MSRLEEVEARLEHTADADWSIADEAAEYRHLARTLAAEVDARDDVITRMLAILEPGPELIANAQMDFQAAFELNVTGSFYDRACEIAGRTE